MITVFTATYNRAHLLRGLYDSLCSQTEKNFEWLVVDDGSTDDTERLIASFIEEGRISIRYFKQENGGKHRAINRGAGEAKGELFFIVDSDDVLPEKSIETISAQWRHTPKDERIGGICGFIAHRDGEVVGRGDDIDNVVCSCLEMRYKYHIVGDMAEIFKTSVIKEFPFPEIESEKFCPEGLVWNRISSKYKLFCFNKVIYYRDYLADGLTAKITKIRQESPIASTTYYKELNELQIPASERIKAAVNYWRFRFCKSPQRKPRLSCLWMWCSPLGWLLHIRDNIVS